MPVLDFLISDGLYSRNDAKLHFLPAHKQRLSMIYGPGICCFSRQNMPVLVFKHRLSMILLMLAVLVGCGDSGQELGGNPDLSAHVDLFEDVSESSGLDFTHFNGMHGSMYLIEIMGSGAALFDYDNDGDLDVYVNQGHMLGADTSVRDAIFQPKNELRDHLFRNDLVIDENGNRTVQFTDVTEESGINATGYGMGVAIGDYDSDGWQDIYVTNWGSNQLYKNNGDGTFTDVTDTSGTDTNELSSSASFVDVNRDGHLDLYVCNYVVFGYDTHRQCYIDTGAASYCGPESETPVPDRLFINNGDGTFADKSAESQIARIATPSLGIVGRDFTGDGWVDLYIANDSKGNNLWVNQQDGTFVDEAVLRGCAFNMDGNPEGSMGIDAADIDGDGDDDLVLGHWNDETNTLYENDGSGNFVDSTSQFKLGVPSRGSTAFGMLWVDFDNDTLLDLYVVNGAVNILEHLLRENETYPLHQRNQLFRNIDGSAFEDISDESGSVCKPSEVSRGLCIGDVDNDGTPDILVANNSGPLRLYLNRSGDDNHWLGLALTTDNSKTIALDCRAEIITEGKTFWRSPRADGSYCSSNDPRILVGLGGISDVQKVIVHWPDGAIEEWSEVQVDQYNELHRGTGRELDGA